MEPRRHVFAVPNTFGAKGKHEITLYDWGDIDAVNVVVCVHGLTRNARDFDTIAAVLAERNRRVFTLSMAGRGMSEWLKDTADYNYASYAADCLAVLDNFHIRTVDWIGTSMGGIIGMIIAAHKDNRIRKLVLNDVGMKLPKEALGRIYDYVRTMPRHFTTRIEADAYLREVFAPFNITDPDLWMKFVENSLLVDNAGFKLACDPSILEPLRKESKDFTEVADVSLADIWEQVSVPTLILHGEQSDVLTAETVRAMKATHPRAESITFPGVGHAPPLMTADQISPVVNWLIPQGLGL